MTHTNRVHGPAANFADSACTPLPCVVPPERNTRQRQTIRDVLTHAARPLSPGEIHADARKRLGAMGLATVYRTLKRLVGEGQVEVVEIPGDSPRFEWAGKGHHHHFHCRRCGKVFEVDACPGDLDRLTPKGFKLQGHELVLFGRCAQCVKG